MKIIHTGDIHLGSALRNLSAEKAGVRKAELLDTFRRLCTYARENGVTAVLIAGDLFDGNQFSGVLKNEVFAAMESAKPVCFFYVFGNHDSGVYFEGRKPDNLYLFSQNHGWQGYDLPENVTVTGIDSQFLNARQYAALRLRAERFNVVMMHGDVRRGDSENEGIALARLQNQAIDYLALGHIHQPALQAERLDGRGRFRYCGCLEGRGFDEIGPRGFFLLEVAQGRLKSEHFVPFARREIVERGVDISACESYYDVERAVLDGLRGVRREDLVKIVLRGRHKAGLKKDVALLSARFAQNFFHVKVADESRIFIDYTAFENDLSERGEFVREACRYPMSEEERAEVLDVGLKALSGEDIDL